MPDYTSRAVQSLQDTGGRTGNDAMVYVMRALVYAMLAIAQEIQKK